LDNFSVTCASSSLTRGTYPPLPASSSASPTIKAPLELSHGSGPTPLAPAGMSVWWDTHTFAGSYWRLALEWELSVAAVAVQCWSVLGGRAGTTLCPFWRRLNEQEAEVDAEVGEGVGGSL